MSPDESELLTGNQWCLLAGLVETANRAYFDGTEPFLAIRVGLAGVSIFHQGATARSFSDMNDIDHLARLGFLEMRRMPSGARLFRITSAGFHRINSDTNAAPGPDDLAKT